MASTAPATTLSFSSSPESRQRAARGYHLVLHLHRFHHHNSPDRPPPGSPTATRMRTTLPGIEVKNCSPPWPPAASAERFHWRGSSILNSKRRFPTVTGPAASTRTSCDAPSTRMEYNARFNFHNFVAGNRTHGLAVDSDQCLHRSRSSRPPLNHGDSLVSGVPADAAGFA